MGWNSRSAYYEEVASDAREIVKECEGKDDCHDTVHQWADNAVIYHSDASDILRFSSNENAIFDQMGGEALSDCTSMGEVHCRAAYYAYSQDIWDAIHNLTEADVDEILEQADCDECAEKTPLDELLEFDGTEGRFCEACAGSMELVLLGNATQ